MDGIEYFYYIGEWIEMSKEKKRKEHTQKAENVKSVSTIEEPEKTESQVYKESQEAEKKPSVREWINRWSGVLSFVIALITLFEAISSIDKMDLRLSNMEDKMMLVEDVNISVVRMQENMSNLTASIEQMNRKNGDVISLVLSDQLALTCGTEEESDLYFADLKLEKSNSIIGTDRYNNEYRASDLTGKNVFIPYLDDGNTVLFYGKINARGHWDGNCLLNTYQDGKLVFISEAQYEDGKAVSYRQFFQSNDDETWYCSERQVYSEGNLGITVQFLGDFQYEAPFPEDDVRVEDMLDCTEISKVIDNSIKTFYYGLTSDSLYNDQTGMAYLVRYNDDGTVNYLYKGRFKDGNPDDQSGQAWMIAQNDDGVYLYYKGEFADNKETGDSSHWERLQTLQEIEEKIEGNSFDCSLTWAIE